jgi:pimeloyl-ACP methyl ester carboxylesterase
MACSVGSMFGLSMIRRRPDLFSAYVGTDQNVGDVRNRQENHRATIERLRANGMRTGAAALEKIGANSAGWTAKDFETAARWTMKSDPRTCERIMTLLKTSIWYSPGHTIRDIRDFVRGMHFSIGRLISEVRSFDAWREGTTFEVPFFIFQGQDDVVTLPGAARAYFDDVVAPVKGMALIGDAGHFAAFTQPEEFLERMMAMVRVLGVDR